MENRFALFTVADKGAWCRSSSDLEVIDFFSKAMKEDHANRRTSMCGRARMTPSSGCSLTLVWSTTTASMLENLTACKGWSKTTAMNSKGHGMTISPKELRFDEDNMWVGLTDGRTVGVPLAWFPRLLHASPEEHENFELSHRGIHWESLDEDISVDGILAGRGDQTRSRNTAA